MWSLAYGSWFKNRVLGNGVCIYTFPGGTPSVSELWVLSLSSGGAGGVPGLCVASPGGGAPMPLRLQQVCAFFAVPCWQGTQPSVWFCKTIAGYLSIAAFTLLCPGNTTPRFFNSRTAACGFVISCRVSSTAARENPSLAILAIFKARRMSDCSSCTWPPCPAIVADMSKTYKKLVAASRVRIGCYPNHIRLCSILEGLQSLFRPFPGMYITKFGCEIPRTGNIVMFKFTDCADKCVGQPWRFPDTGRDELVM